MEANDLDRFGSFFQRVQTERSVLRIVNNTFPTAKLHGLTEAAICAWSDKVRSLHPSMLDHIVTLIETLAKRIDAFADQSRVVFSGEKFAAIGTYELVNELEAACVNLQMA
jgi:hypothetical protein